MIFSQKQSEMFKRVFLIVLVAFLFVGCNAFTKDEISNEPATQLMEGDLLFINLDCGPLCDAIEAVTEGAHGKDFSHCGMLAMNGNTLMVIEAIGDKVQYTSITDFLARSADTTITVGRPSSLKSEVVSRAVAYAQEQLGESYDDSYLFDNGKWYCSELIYESFKAANSGLEFFEPSPMTFKVPGEDEFFNAWVDYYENLHQPIPEGMLGVNPGGLSRSEHLNIFEVPVDL
jgi:hypothetical protein